LALSIVWLAEAMDARVGGGHSYRGSRRSSGGVSFGSGSGVSGDAGLLLMELIRLFLWLPWPLRLVMVAVIIGLIIRVNYAGWQVSYSSFQTGWPSGASGVLLTSPRLPPSIGARAQRLDPAFSEVLFLERAVLLVTRLFEASSSPKRLEPMAPFASAEVVAELLRRTGGAEVRGVIIGQVKM
jgi:hypothetical protein